MTFFFYAQRGALIYLFFYFFFFAAPLYGAARSACGAHSRVRNFFFLAAAERLSKAPVAPAFATYTLPCRCYSGATRPQRTRYVDKHTTYIHRYPRNKFIYRYLSQSSNIIRLFVNYNSLQYKPNLYHKHYIVLLLTIPEVGQFSCP